MFTDSAGRQIRPYTIRFELEPDGGYADVRAVTSLGELKAVAMASARLTRRLPEINFSTVTVVTAEEEFVIDPANDALDHWGGCD